MNTRRHHHMPPIPKDYMGDGIYIEDLGYTVALTTENGIDVLNRVLIEPTEWEAIKRYMTRVENKRKGDD